MSIKKQQSKVLQDLINNVDNTAANIYKSKKQRQLKELSVIQKNESKRELILFNLKSEVTKNIKNLDCQSKFGTKTCQINARNRDWPYF